MDTKLEFFKSYIGKKGENHRYGIGAVDNEGNKYIQVLDGTKSDIKPYDKREEIVVGKMYVIYQFTINKINNDDFSGETEFVDDIRLVNVDEYKYYLSYEDIVEISDIMRVKAM